MTDPGQLVSRFVAGDQDAYNELVERFQHRVFAISLRMLGDRDDALDATQDVFLTLYRKADRYQERAAFSTWLHRVTVNVCYDHIRRRRRHRTQTMPEAFEPVDPTALDAFNSVELSGQIEAALGTLPADFRAAVILADVEDLPIQQVAAALGLPLGTAKSRVFRGRRRLAQELGNLSSHSNPQSRDDS